MEFAYHEEWVRLTEFFQNSILFDSIGILNNAMILQICW